MNDDPSITTRFDRRTLLRGAASAVVAGGTVSLLAACGDDEPGDNPPGDAADSGSRGGEIQFSSWGGEYSDAWRDAIVAPFTAATGTKVVFDDAPGEHVAKLRAQERASNVTWDVVEASFADYFTLLEQDLIQSLPSDLVASLRGISSPGMVGDYGVGVGAAAVQVITSGPGVSKPPSTPGEFWDVDGFPGSRAMWKDGFLDNVLTALIADGVPPDALVPLDLDRAFAKLDEIRPSIDVFWTSGDQFEQIVRDGEVDIAFGWDGRAWKLRRDNPKVTIAYSGGLVESNFLTIPRGADNTEGALAFIEYYATHPKQQAGWVEKNHYATNHEKVTTYLDEETVETLWPAHAEELVVLDPDKFEADFQEVQDRWYDWLEG